MKIIKFTKHGCMILMNSKTKITKTKQAKGEVGDVKGNTTSKVLCKRCWWKKICLNLQRFLVQDIFKEVQDKPDDDPSSTNQGLNDKGKKTKPSQYTKKFKQMYGEKKMLRYL